MGSGPEIEPADEGVVITPTIEVAPTLDADTEQWFTASVPELNLEASGRTREALSEDVADQLKFLWDEYAMADDVALSEDAIELKAHILGRMKRGNG